jgi:hypothetical protein
MKTQVKLIGLLILFFTFQQKLAAVTHVGDTINVPRIITPPVIDGSGSDLCWDSAVWNPMPYVWIPYGTTVPAADFTGRFKTVWNEKENLMYFLFEITDDIFVNGYVYSAANGNYYLYDVVEVFIDENRSGGVHETNNNAFAYHITGGNSTSEYDAIDMWGSTRVNYRDHFPEFKRVQNGNVHTWEFSMMVLKDTYTPGSVPGDFKSTLQADKRMGFSAAYCDDDHSSSNPQRDHFIASKYQTAAESNNSYINASIFGFMKLVIEPTSGPATSINPGSAGNVKINVYPNPINESTSISFTNTYTGPVGISVYNMTGKLERKVTAFKNQQFFEQNIDFTAMYPGIYFVRLNAGKDQVCTKITKQR